ncbi:hypothetical protein FJQ98_16585 [Lysinibacillus agricola]|uniref:Uncharacterized protein n=1 Tax=Lysinibacillus agricola TaxID=2590012 RepID=A0ABX7APL4_9BACI|nr:MULTISPECIES: hypothetical protein [Lysinibacillus]QQP10863.1 hypothetical protein FJQ98_16585 [Lysinibacillus agricola]
MDIEHIIMITGSIVAIFKGITSSLKDIHDMRTNKKRPSSKPSAKRKKKSRK